MNQVFLAGFVAGFSLAAVTAVIYFMLYQRNLLAAVKSGEAIELHDGNQYSVIPVGYMDANMQVVNSLRTTNRLLKSELHARNQQLAQSRGVSRKLASRLRELGVEA